MKADEQVLRIHFTKFGVRAAQGDNKSKPYHPKEFFKNQGYWEHQEPWRKRLGMGKKD